MKALILIFVLTIQGCTVVSIVDAAASTAVTVGTVAVKGTGALIGAAIPDGDDEDDDD